ncbi:MAG: hypothetical protein ACLFVC_07980 [Opitutales bacterium]
MTQAKRTYALVLLLAGALLLSACSSTRTQNGVTIEKDRSYNPLDYVPGF